MIRMNVSKETLEQGIGLEKVVQKIFWYQIFWKDAIGKDIRLMAYQKKMYNPEYAEIPKNRKLKKLDFTYCRSFSFLFLFRLIPWSAGALCVHFPAWASKTHSRRCLRCP